MANIDLSVSIVDDEEQMQLKFVSHPYNLQCERDMMQEKQKIIEYTSSKEQAAQGYDGRKIVIFTHHTSDSKLNQKYYIFAVNREQDSIASALVKNFNQKQTTQIISKQQSEARVSEGSGLQQFPQQDGLQFSAQQTLNQPLSLQNISTQPIVEAESHNDHQSANFQMSQMMKDDVDAELQEEAQDLSMTKDSDRATIAEALT
ncbi:MAG: hypothetical protein EZS28_021117 [Streblomastix strix]|uniref:Uncharacterized protein n=1 Tax=Streblomastix strix TaxID=222440 RepID=A0A5J4VL37_9EUKA|nr:MAG: hypothetical protein EZS28_021117 [Streblomastix strix]